MIEIPGGGALVAARLDPEGHLSDDHVQVWNPSTGDTRGFKLRPAEALTAVTIAKPTTDPGYAIVIGDIGGGVQAFDVDTGEQRWYHRVFDRPVTALAGGELAGRQVIVSGDEEGKVRVWELATGQLISGPHQVPDLDGGITAVAIIPSWDGGRLALAGQETRPAQRSVPRQATGRAHASGRPAGGAARRLSSPGLHQRAADRDHPPPRARASPVRRRHRRRRATPKDRKAPVGPCGAAAADRAARHPPRRRPASGQRRPQHGGRERR